ncbi:WAT1-related protein At5g40230-like [Chenopodium quinoa]|uniref:WAT1-related protein At5g40230-like n=1 Tax=Chenopodium quinoa TaxID=63459 RepID=UPI000B78EFFE|nr:WAT1-related protein At5g40230-like [Chenopodium quinoa]
MNCDPGCVLCDQKEENVQHLFFECNHSTAVWSKILCLLRIQRMPQKLNEELEWILKVCRNSRPRQKLIYMCFTESIYSIWLQRNSYILSGQIKSLELLVRDIVFRVACSNTLNKAAMTQGMSNYVYITDTHAMSLVILIPAAFLCHWYVIDRYVYKWNVCRKEILNLRSNSCILKLIGTIVSISGAFIMIFYHGLLIIIVPSPTKSSLHSLVQLQSQPNWVFGGTFLLISCILISLAYVIKVIILLFSFVSLNSLFRTVTLIRLKGPVFVAMFKPLQMIIAVIMGVSFLGDILHLGSVIGELIIAAGFYSVIKGKAEEEEMLKKDDEDKLIYSLSIKEEESHSLNQIYITPPILN